MDTVENIGESRTARLPENRGPYRVLSLKTRALLRREKARYIKDLGEDVGYHLNSNDLRPA